MSVEYSTMPRAFRGARSMSWMMALSGSLGSTSPCAMPTIFSNCPTLPKVAPPKVGDSVRVISSLVIRPSAGLAKANDAANKDPSRYLVRKAFLLITSSNRWFPNARSTPRLLGIQVGPRWDLGRHGRLLGKRAPIPEGHVVSGDVLQPAAVCGLVVAERGPLAADLAPDSAAQVISVPDRFQKVNSAVDA